MAQFAAQGAQVAFVDVQDEAARALAGTVAAIGGPRPLYMHADVRDTVAYQEAIAELARALGPVGVLINNAANDARHTAACFSAFAKMLTRRDANEALFHLVMCMAFEQESKNAWKVKDYAAIEHALRNALGEASTALRIEPRNVHAPLLVAGLQEKLVGLTSERASSP